MQLRVYVGERSPLAEALAVIPARARGAALVRLAESGLASSSERTAAALERIAAALEAGALPLPRQEVGVTAPEPDARLGNLDREDGWSR